MKLKRPNSWKFLRNESRAPRAEEWTDKDGSIDREWFCDCCKDAGCSCCLVGHARPFEFAEVEGVEVVWSRPRSRDSAAPVS
jgi:hypothetical protein